MSILAILAISVIGGAAPLEPPYPIIEYPNATLGHTVIELRCYDDSAAMTAELSGGKLVSWRRGAKAFPHEILARVNQRLPDLAKIFYIRGMCNRSSEELMFVGEDASGKEASIITPHIGDHLWIYPSKKP